jgi:hypothetical protein
MNGDIDSAFKRLEEWYPQVIKVYYTVCSIFLFMSFPQNASVATKNNGDVIEIIFVHRLDEYSGLANIFNFISTFFFSLYSQKKLVTYSLLYNKDLFFCRTKHQLFASYSILKDSLNTSG